MNELLAQPVRMVVEIVETWHDENGNWYRIYSDGWCEQGGFAPYEASEYRTITLHKPYLTSMYSLTGGVHEPDRRYSSNPFGFCIKSKTNSSFVAGAHDDTTWNYCAFTWEAKGYIS